MATAEKVARYENAQRGSVAGDTQTEDSCSTLKMSVVIRGSTAKKK